MRKFTMLVALVAMASFAFAQYQIDYAISKESQQFKKQTHSTKAEGDVIWSVDFEEASPVWTLGHDVGTKTWEIGDQNDAPTLWEPSPGSYYFQYLGDYSLTGNTPEGDADGHWAWIDIISDLPALGGVGQEVCNTWIQFDNINLTGVDYPKLVFYQLFRPLNDVETFVDFSVDGGSTWTSVEVNANVLGNAYGDVVYEMLVGPYIADEANVSLRFRWATNAVNSFGVGYGWQIDDIKIIENPNYDLKLVDARMNFFEYVDYTDPANASRFHSSSHYGQIPDEQFGSELAAMWFNVMVENKGNFAATPDVNVTILDPLGTEVFNETITGDELAVNVLDTVDVIEVEFMLPENFELGEYTVMYEISEEGNTDFYTDDNVFATTFNVTDNIMGRDAGNITSQTGMQTWGDGGVDGEMLGTTYLFLYDTEITSMWIYIGDRTDVGTAIVAHVMEYSEADDDWIDMSTSSLYLIGEDDLDGWVEFVFPDAITITTVDGYKQVMAAVEFYYNGDGNEIMIGIDRSVPTSFWGASWYFMGGDNVQQWFSITNWASSALGMRLQTIDVNPETEAIFTADNTNIMEGDVVNFTDQSLNADQWEWTFEGGDPSTSQEQNPVVTYNVEGVYDVTLTVTNTTTSETDTRVIENYITVVATHVSPAATLNFNVYPNPANDIINIDAEGVLSVRIINSLGQVMYERNNESVNIIDVSDFNKGWYILEVNNGTEVIRRNIIVQ